jgi:hypothetical protein
MPPLKYSFYCFIIDAGVFICWMVAFGLLDSVSLPLILILGFCGFVITYIYSKDAVAIPIGTGHPGAITGAVIGT